MSIKRLIKKLLGINTSVVQWKGEYNSWESAKKSSTGYDSDAIFSAVVDAVDQAEKEDDWFERDGTVIKSGIVNTPFLTGFLLAMKEASATSPTVLDFGGGLGSVFNQHKRFLKDFPDLTWNIIEQGKFIEIGQEKYTSETLRFYNSISDYSNVEGATDLVLISSVLQYLEKPYDVLNELMALNPKYIIVDLSVISDDLAKDTIAIQHIGKAIYGKEVSYPCWFFNKQNLMKQFKDKYQIIIDQDSYLGVINHGNQQFNYHYLLLKRI